MLKKEWKEGKEVKLCCGRRKRVDSEDVEEGTEGKKKKEPKWKLCSGRKKMEGEKN